MGKCPKTVYEKQDWNSEFMSYHIFLTCKLNLLSANQAKCPQVTAGDDFNVKKKVGCVAIVCLFRIHLLL